MGGIRLCLCLDYPGTQEDEMADGIAAGAYAGEHPGKQEDGMADRTTAGTHAWVMLFCQKEGWQLFCAGEAWADLPAPQKMPSGREGHKKKGGGQRQRHRL